MRAPLCLACVVLWGAARPVVAQAPSEGFVRARPASARPVPLTPEQQRRRVDYLREADIRKTGSFLDESDVGTTVLTSGDAQTNYMIMRRRVASQVEVHARWDDLVIVRSGRGAIEFGERVEGTERRAPGEWRGGRLVPTHRLVVGPGDIVRIPAAVPHRFEVGGGEPLEYLLVKQRRAGLPLAPRGLP